MATVPTDIEIAQQAKLRPIVDVAADLVLGPDDLDLYGKYKAKVTLDVARRPTRGRLVLVTGINPTAAGEGKTTTSVGLTQAFRRLGKNASLCIREPSLGPVFGVKRHRESVSIARIRQGPALKPGVVDDIRA